MLNCPVVMMGGFGVALNRFRSIRTQLAVGTATRFALDSYSGGCWSVMEKERGSGLVHLICLVPSLAAHIPLQQHQEGGGPTFGTFIDTP